MTLRRPAQPRGASFRSWAYLPLMPGAAAPRHPPLDPLRAWAAGRDACSAGWWVRPACWNARAPGAGGLVGRSSVFPVRPANSFVRPANPPVRSAIQVVSPRGSSGRPDGPMVRSSAPPARSAIRCGRSRDSRGRSCGRHRESRQQAAKASRRPLISSRDIILNVRTSP